MKCCNGIFILCGLYTENMAPGATVVTQKFAFMQLNYFTSINTNMYSKVQSVWLYVVKKKKKKRKTVVMHR